MGRDARSPLVLEMADSVLRSWWTLVAGACFGLAAAVTVLHFLPRTYEATTKIYVAPQKIPPQYVTTTVTDDLVTRLEVLQEAVLSRPYMLKLIEQTYESPAGDEEADRLIRDIRARLTVKVTRAANLFELTYRDGDPERVARVVNALTDLYIQEAAQGRASQAAETTRTLEELAEEARERLLERERQITQLKADHLYETADYLDANLRLLESRQRDLDIKEAALAAARERLALEPGADDGSGTASPSSPDPEEVLEQELEALRLRYSERHPAVKAKRRELEQHLARAEAESRAAGDPAAPEAAGSGASTVVESAPRGEIGRLEHELRRTREDIELYQRRIEATPHVEQQLTELSKGYDALKTQYEDYRAKAESAKGAQRIEETHKGQQFEFLERATAPRVPVQPVPLTFYAAGVVIGLVLFVAPTLIVAILKPKVCSHAGLQALAESPVLATIPPFPTADTRRRARLGHFVNWILSLLSAAVLAGAVAGLG